MDIFYERSVLSVYALIVFKVFQKRFTTLYNYKFLICFFEITFFLKMLTETPLRIHLRCDWCRPLIGRSENVRIGMSQVASGMILQNHRRLPVNLKWKQGRPNSKILEKTSKSWIVDQAMQKHPSNRWEPRPDKYEDRLILDKQMSWSAHLSVHFLWYSHTQLHKQRMQVPVGSSIYVNDFHKSTLHHL